MSLFTIWRMYNYIANIYLKFHDSTVKSFWIKKPFSKTKKHRQRTIAPKISSTDVLLLKVSSIISYSMEHSSRNSCIFERNDVENRWCFSLVKVATITSILIDRRGRLTFERRVKLFVLYWALATSLHLLVPTFTCDPPRYLDRQGSCIKLFL